MEKGLIKDILLKLNDDFSNIDEVYNSLKNNWFEKNEGKSELEFIDCFDFTKGYDVETINESLFAEIQLKNLKKLSTYLGKKPAKLELTLTDHYYKYKRSKRFGFATTLALNNEVFKKNDFQTAKQELDKQFEIFEFIYDKLNDIDKLEFISDYCDQLEKLKSKQQFTKFKEVIDMQLLKINGQCDRNNEPQRETDKKKENPYPEIFPNVFSFMLFECLHNHYKDSNNLLADYSFVYRKMWDLGHILEYQKSEMFRDWISKEPYEIVVGSKFKTLDRCKTDSKENNFNLTFDLVEKL